MISTCRPKLSDSYTLSYSKLLENHTLHSGTYLYSPYVAVPPVPLFPHQYIVYSNTNLLLSTNSGLSLRFQVAGCLLLVAGEVASSHGVPPPPRSFWSATSTVFQKALPPPKSNLHQEYSYHTAIMMITSLLKKTTTFWDTKIISFYCKWINMRCKINCKSSFSYT